MWAELVLNLSAISLHRSLVRACCFFGGTTRQWLFDNPKTDLPCTRQSADLLYNIISRRHESKSLVLTTNLPFKQWNTVFPGAACVSAMIDRFVQHCHIIDIDADSWRQKESLAMTETRQAEAGAPRTAAEEALTRRSWSDSRGARGQIPAGAALTYALDEAHDAPMRHGLLAGSHGEMARRGRYGRLRVSGRRQGDRGKQAGRCQSGEQGPSHDGGSHIILQRKK